MQVDPQSALRGVRARLVGAVGATSVTLVCLLYAMLSSLSTFGATFALTVGLCSFGAAVALLLSARHEEEVHELAAELGAPHPPSPEADAPGQPRALPEPMPMGTDALCGRSPKRSVVARNYSAKTDGGL